MVCIINPESVQLLFLILENCKNGNKSIRSIQNIVTLIAGYKYLDSCVSLHSRWICLSGNDFFVFDKLCYRNFDDDNGT